MTGKRFTLIYGIDENPFEWDIMDNDENTLICRCNGKPICDLLNEFAEENKELKLQNGDLLYQIGEVGKNNKTCRECECFIPENKYCYMWDMEVEADDVVVACDQRKVKMR